MVGKDGKKQRPAERKRKKGNEESTEDTDNEGTEEGKEAPKRPNLNIIIRFDEGDGVKKIDPLKLTKALKAHIGEIKHAKILRDGNLLIGCNSEGQVEKAKKLGGLCKVKIRAVVKVGEKINNESKGIITGVPLSVNMKDLVENLKERNKEIKGARRMTRGAERIETETVLLEFETKEMPREVFFGLIRFSVREYMPKPVRCFNCQEFGHIAKMCKGKRRCARCSGDHEYGKCGVGVKPKCCSCGGEHSVAFWGCEVMKQQTIVQKTKVAQKVTYAEACKVVEKEKQNGKSLTGEKQIISKVMEMVEMKIEEEKKKMVTFIAGVINATSDVKSKTERIQIIVKAACHSCLHNNPNKEY
ncbi:uncharacterized protein LOC106949576 isoform X3 [Poecilia latipinna]|uniref:uncharacterized protein LOC106949576 isoform X1 n=1 Tax=Poecilia latipinna TaxID=48699 RepID=UPI00072E8041|nr:PREDICTED: uncharacterized protein LOC106949576 isoform X1 [Poecilia latipinna]XP_014891408.1 PREDICTED: uncharacterized protein LOC106949576 isoform X2 [Poecilia latipinna]XP_014891409.1 PREDICTED: uncharacterized protein LOC106949576 isoform X3 [Poecilia latipinna]